MGKKKHEIMYGIPDVMAVIDKPSICAGSNIPEEMILDTMEDSGLYFGLETNYGKGYFAGKPSERDGNVMTIGTNGSGKSYVCAKSSIETWRDPFLALDIKGELSDHYSNLYRGGRVNRPHITFAPMKESVHYDPYAMLKKDDPHFVQYVREIAYAIIPMPLQVREPYWINLAQDLLSAAIVYFFTGGLDFIETISIVQTTSASELCRQIKRFGCKDALMFISEIGGLKPEQQSAIGTELKRHTIIFATDPYIQAALCGDGEQEKTFSWESVTTDADTPNVFLRLDQDKLEHWSGVIRLMLTQLVRQLERRPDKKNPQYHYMKPILLLLDEFPLLGKMEVITNALTTLRSKKVTFCLMLQSITQLDAIYGADVRRIMVDNCQYKVVLNVTEPDSQEYFSKLFGSVLTGKRGLSQSYDPYTERSTYGRQLQESREPLIHPHEFATNRDIWLYTPDGFFSTIRLPVSTTHLHVLEFDRALQTRYGRYGYDH